MACWTLQISNLLAANQTVLLTILDYLESIWMKATVLLVDLQGKILPSPCFLKLVKIFTMFNFVAELIQLMQCFDQVGHESVNLKINPQLNLLHSYFNMQKMNESYWTFPDLSFWRIILKFFMTRLISWEKVFCFRLFTAQPNTLALQALEYIKIVFLTDYYLIRRVTKGFSGNLTIVAISNHLYLCICPRLPRLIHVYIQDCFFQQILAISKLN